MLQGSHLRKLGMIKRGFKNKTRATCCHCTRQSGRTWTIAFRHGGLTCEKGKGANEERHKDDGEIGELQIAVVV